MRTLELGWRPALVLSAGLAVAAVAAPVLPGSWGRSARTYLRECTIVALLYALWQLAGAASRLNGERAFDRARWIVRFEHHWLPSERLVQHLIENQEPLARAANWYYAAMHFTGLGLMLAWLFVRHRERYPRVRNVLVLLTGSSLLIQFIPVAPPRLLPEDGFIDLAARYGESVYAVSTITIDQLSAMPSVHVGWSLLVAWAVLTASPSRYRWWVLLHPLITVFVVVATGNHFWLDGIVAAALLVASVVIVQGFERLVATLRRQVVGRSAGRPHLAGTDHGHPGVAGAAHRSQGVGNTVETDRAGDELVGPQGG